MDKLEGTACVVTGGAGFIGSHLCERLVSEGSRVTCLDNLSTGRLEYLDGVRRAKGFRFVKGDLMDEKSVYSAIKEADIVFHMGARVGVKRYVQDPADVIKVNVLGTHNVLEACARYKVRKLIFASTSEVYGKNPMQPLREDSNRVLGSTMIDRWCYASSKALDEHLINAYHRSGRVPCVILRYFNAYGARQDASDYGGVVSIFMRRVRNNQPPLIHGDGMQTRSFCYVSDSIEGTIQAALSERAIGENINIGNPTETKILDLRT